MQKVGFHIKLYLPTHKFLNKTINNKFLGGDQDESFWKLKYVEEKKKTAELIK